GADGKGWDSDEDGLVEFESGVTANEAADPLAEAYAEMEAKVNYERRLAQLHEAEKHRPDFKNIRFLGGDPFRPYKSQTSRRNSMPPVIEGPTERERREFREFLGQRDQREFEEFRQTRRQQESRELQESNERREADERFVFAGRHGRRIESKHTRYQG